MQEVATVALVIPCYNEEKRLNFEQIRALITPDLKLIFVNDGSRDQTLAILRKLESQHPSNVQVVDLQNNQGKAEAVRAGLLHALEQRYLLVGYIDADFATPAEEVLRLIEVAKNVDCKAILASRIRLLGTNIDRKTQRHYLGRIFATFVSLGLGLRVYDTQCGAKIFRPNPALINSLKHAFETRWVFDVELISRLLSEGLSAKDFLEVPLRKWSDVDGSKLTLKAMIKAGLDLVFLVVRFRLQPNKTKKAR